MSHACVVRCCLINYSHSTDTHMDNSSTEKDNTVKEWNYHLTTTFIVCTQVKQWKLLQTVFGMPLQKLQHNGKQVM